MKKVLVFLAIMVVLLSVERSQAITCGRVDSYLAPCLQFLIGGPSSPSQACCNGVKDLQASASTQDDRRAACQCMKQAVSQYTGIKPDKASQLPKDCGVEVSVPITMDVDCSKVP